MSAGDTGYLAAGREDGDKECSLSIPYRGGKRYAGDGSSSLPRPDNEVSWRALLEDKHGRRLIDVADVLFAVGAEADSRDIGEKFPIIIG